MQALSSSLPSAVLLPALQRPRLDNIPPANTLPPVPIDLSPFQAILLDLDGTIYHEEHPLPGAVELIHRLQRDQRSFACLSNSTSSPHRIAQRLQRMGVQVDPSHIYTAAAAAADHVLQRYAPRPRIYNLATEGLHDLLDERVTWARGPGEPCDAVIAGAITNIFATEDRQRVALILLRDGAHLVGICADRVYPSPRGLEFGSGAFCAMLAYAASVTPFFCGKPQEVFFHNLCQKLNADPSRCVLVGDNLEADIGGARRLGMRTILTLSGITTARDVESIPPDLRPDWIIPDLRHI